MNQQQPPNPVAGGPLRYPAPSAAWYAVGILFIIYCVSTLDRFVISLLVDPIRKDLRITDSQVGLLQSAFSVLYAFGALPIGWVVDRWYRRWVIFIGMVFWSLATAACSLATTFWQLFLARVGVGAGECALSPAAYSILADSFPKERLTLATATAVLGTSVGQGLGIFLGGLVVAALTAAGPQTLPLLGKLQPWQLVFITLGLPGVILSLLVFTMREPARLKDEQLTSTAVAPAMGSRSEYLRFFRLRRRFIVCHHLGIACAFIVQAALGNWLPVYMARSFGLGPAKIGTFYGILYGVCTPIGLLAGGALIDKLFRRGIVDAHLRVFLGCMIVTVPAGIVALTSNSFQVFLAGNAVVQLCLGVMPAAGAAALQIVTPSDVRGRASAVFLLIYVVTGAALGPALVGFVTDHVFHNDHSVGHSLSVIIAVFAPLSALALRIGMRPMREAVVRQGQALVGAAS